MPKLKIVTILTTTLLIIVALGAIVMTPPASAGCYYNPKDSGLYPDRNCRNIAREPRARADWRHYPGTRHQRYVGPRGIHRGRRHGGHGHGGGIILGPPTTYGGHMIVVPPKLLGYQVCTEGVGCRFVPVR